MLDHPGHCANWSDAQLEETLRALCEQIAFIEKQQRGRLNVAYVSPPERLRQAVLQFFDPSPWTPGRLAIWKALTGVDEVGKEALVMLATRAHLATAG